MRTRRADALQFRTSC